MADEWIKFRHCLWAHPKVVTLSLRLRNAGVTLCNAVGALIRAWCVADQHADDNGNVPMGAEALDALVEIPGFAQALASVGWLVVGDGSLQFVNYQQHNGPTAKKRAQSTLRMQLSRMRDVSVTQERHESVTRRRRRNRRREENTPPTPRKGGARARTGEHPLFEQFWAAYPRHEARRKAAEAFARLNPSPELLATMLAAITWQKERGCLQPRSVDGRSTVPYPASWINASRWEDAEVQVQDCRQPFEAAFKAAMNARKDGQRADLF